MFRYSKFSLSLSLWILKKYALISILSFVLCSLFLWFVAYFTNFLSEESLLPILVILFIFGFVSSLAILIFVLFSFLKPLSSSVRKIEYLAKHSSEETINSEFQLITQGQNHLTEDEPEEFQDLNKNLASIYQNIRTKSINLMHDKAELKAITDAVSDAILAIDKSQKIIFSNPQSKNLFLLKKSKGDSLSESIHSNEILNGCKKCLTSGVSSSLELELEVGEHQQTRLFEVSISPLIHTQNQIDGAVIVFFDTTEIKNTEKSHTDFVANVSHELKTPLTAIKGFTETMITDLEDKNYDQIQNFLNIVNRNIERLIHLIDDLLSLSHVDSISNLIKKEVDTREITAVACETIPTDQHQINYIFKADKVLASRRWLEQVMYNLVNNAVKYTPSNSTIDIIWEKHPHFVLLTVKDNGEGIPLQHQHRIFERFYRIEQDRSRKKGGTGIGLAIVSQIMHKHGGNVYLTSRRRGKGAKFTCTFPR